jgi:hypothetical protein
VDVLDREHGRSLEVAGQRARDGTRIRSLGEPRRGLSARLPGHVEERPERRRRREAVARAGENRHVHGAAERAHERRLPRSGLAADEHQPPARVERVA